MSFRENLKSALIYSGIHAKDLAKLSGIKKHTLDNYLNTHNSIPSAEAAVKIARVLGVSVEYLVTGVDSKQQNTNSQPLLEPDLQELVQAANPLDKNGRRLAIALVRTLQKYCD